MSFREEGDLLGGYFRQEIDRDIVGVSGILQNSAKEPLIRQALDILRRVRRISILDGGCGSGRTLFGLKDQLVFRTSFPPDSVFAVGVNNQDFSGESRLQEVRKAVKTGFINYIVDDLETVNLKSEDFNIAYFFETLIHNPIEKVNRMIGNVLPNLAPDGIAYFNLYAAQRSNPLISDLLTKLRENGYGIFEFQRTNPYDHQVRDFVQLVKPGNHE